MRDDTENIINHLTGCDPANNSNEFLGWLNDMPTAEALQKGKSQNLTTLRDVLDNKKSFGKSRDSVFYGNLPVDFVEKIHSNAVLLSVDDFIKYYLPADVIEKVLSFLKKTNGAPYIEYLYNTLSEHLPINIRFLPNDVPYTPMVIIINDKHGQVLGIEVILKETFDKNIILKIIKSLLKGILGTEPFSMMSIYIVEDRTLLYNTKSTNIFAYRVHESTNYFFLSYEENILITGSAFIRYTSGLKVPNFSDYVRFSSIGTYTGGRAKEGSKNEA